MLHLNELASLFNYCQALHAFCCPCVIGAWEAAPPLPRQLGWQAGIRQVLVANELYRCIIFAFKKLSFVPYVAVKIKIRNNAQYLFSPETSNTTMVSN